MNKNFERHPLSALCGDMDPEVFMLLQDSVGVDGVQDPILLYDGMVLDGWHRYTAARNMGMPCPTETFAGDFEDAKRLVLRKHTRRDWTPGQRATATAAVSCWHPAGRAAPGAGLATNAELAAVADVSERTMRQAKAVVTSGTAEVVKAVMDGAVSVKRAEKIAQLPAKKQSKALAEAINPAPGAAPPARTRPVLVKPQVGASLEALEELKERNEVLTEELDTMTARLAVHFMEGSAEEKSAYTQVMTDLRDENKRLRIRLESVTISYDAAIAEKNELMKQCQMYRNQLAKRA